MKKGADHFGHGMFFEARNREIKMAAKMNSNINLKMTLQSKYIEKLQIYFWNETV